MRKYYIYTDASVKEKSTTFVGIIVSDYHIVDIYYRHINKKTDANKAEHRAIFRAKHYLKEKFNVNDCIIYTDNQSIANMLGKWCKWVRGHQNSRKNWKYKFNCLADYIARNGLDNWRKYWYDKI